MTTTTNPRGTYPMTEPQPVTPAPLSWDDLANAVAMCATAQWDPLNHPEWKATLERMAALHDAGPQGTGPAAPAEPEEPAGEFARVHIAGRIIGYDGWVSDGLLAGAPCLDVRDETGRLIAKVPPRSVDLYEPAVLPQVPGSGAGPGPLPQLPPDATIALPAGEAYEGFYEPGSEDEGHGDAFPGRDERDDHA